MTIRKATRNDIAQVEALYDAVHTAEEEGRQTIGWIRGIYPVRATAELALSREDLFVLEEDGEILGCGIINGIQDSSYRGANWTYDSPDEKVCVLHTLVISPKCGGKGYGSRFLAFYEAYALAHGCPALRLDTNEKNAVARAMYKKRGYREVGIVATDFNGIPGIRLVLLEKYLGNSEKIVCG